MFIELYRHENENHIGIVKINRPSALNALNRDVLVELEATINMIEEQDIRCLVFSGSGEKAFIAGADIAEMKNMSRKEAEDFSLFGNALFERIHNLPVPTIAAVTGYALGGGCELAMACDIRLASENAVFGQPETGLGIIPGFGGTQRLPRIVGVSKAKEIIFTGAFINAEEALRIGLVNHLYPIEELFDKAIDMARKIVNNSPNAIRVAKYCIDKGNGIELCDALKLESRRFSETFESNDQKEGMMAFLEKREHKPFES